MRIIVHFQLASAVATSLFFAVPAAAQQYPTKPIQIVIAYAPGTSTEILARMLGLKFTEVWGQPVIIVNRPGATGSIGMGIGAHALPDGYTLTMVAGAPLGINPHVYLKLPYDPIKDFAPITNMTALPQTLVSSPSFAANSLKELVEIAKAKPGQLNYASLGPSSTGHLTMAMLRSRAGFQATNIPFKGSGEAHAQVMGGQVPLMFDSLPAVLQNIRSGKLRALVVSTPARSLFLPDVPTIAESGYPGFAVTAWIGIAAPAGTPVPILDKLNAEIVRILKSPEWKEPLNTLAFTPVGDSREAFGRFIKAEIEMWGKAVKDAGVEPE